MGTKARAMRDVLLEQCGVRGFQGSSQRDQKQHRDECMKQEQRDTGHSPGLRASGALTTKKPRDVLSAFTPPNLEPYRFLNMAG